MEQPLPHIHPKRAKLTSSKWFECAFCGNSFQSRKADKNRTPKYCSSACFGKSIQIHKFCKQCGKEIPGNNQRKNSRIFCSVKCRTDSRRGVTLSPEWRESLSEGRKKSDKCKGPNLYNWKGGAENIKQRNKVNYHQRRSIGEIDGLYLKILYKLQYGKCFYCDNPLEGRSNKAIEHLTPVSKGGNNNWLNLVYACKKCNSKKHNKTLIEFAIECLRPDWLNNPVQLISHKIKSIQNCN